MNNIENYTGKEGNFTDTHSIIRSLVDNYINEYNDSNISKSVITGLPTGFYDLDYHTRGFQKGNLIVLAGRRWSSKFILALNIASYTVLKEKITTAIFSTNMDAKEVVKKIIALNLGDNAPIMYRGIRDDEEKNLLKKCMETLSEVPLVIDDRQYITVEEIREKCIKLKNEDNLGFVVIDSLQLLDVKQVEKGKDKRIVIASSLKELAKEIKCPIIVISEISSDGESKLNVRPELSDLDDKDYTKQFADLIILLYVDRNNRNAENTDAELIIAKNRNGSVGKVRLCISPNGLLFRNRAW